MLIILPEPYRRPFLTRASRLAQPPLTLSLRGDQLEILALPPRETAVLLAESSFLRHERQLLDSLSQRHFPRLAASQQLRLRAVAQALIEEDVDRGGTSGGPRRLRRVALALLPYLEQGRLDFPGFCRFVLAGQPSYLRRMLEQAADELAAGQEEEEYLALLARFSQPQGEERHLHLFFSPGAICHIWLRGRPGVRLLEGGCFREREDMLIANVLGLRPASVTLNGLACAPLRLVALLEQCLGGRLMYEESDYLTSDPAGDMI